MKTSSLILASLLIVVPLIISQKEQLGLGKDIVWSAGRAVIQLFIVGYLLNFIFGLEHPTYMILLVLIMIFNAAYNAKKKAPYIKNALAISFFSILVGASITSGVLVLSGTLAFEANEIIPTSGMIISNAMVAIGLSYRNMQNSFREKREEIEVKLALGAEVKQASKAIMKESIKVGMMPTIDSAKTLGIVSLPGMMTGLILGGASPIIAVKFQMMVTFMLLSATSIATMICTYLSYQSFFNERKQLKRI